MKRIIIISICLMILLTSSGCGKKDNATPPKENSISNIIVFPEQGTLDVVFDYDDTFKADVDDFSEEYFEDYKNEIKKLGFDYDILEDSIDEYIAYNDEGYLIDLYLYSDDTLSIGLDAPIEFGALNWPTSDLAALLPIPESNIGKTEWENSDGFVIYVGDITPEEYADYVDECSQKGFDVDYNKGDDFYYADNASGVSVDLRYEGFNTMFVRVDAPEEQEDIAEEVPNEEPATNPSETDSTEVDPDLKATMDEYEEFMNSYVEFMKKYNSSSDTSGMLLEYADVMAKYADFTTKINSYDADTMSDADAKYYLDVVNRVNAKLLELY